MKPLKGSSMNRRDGFDISYPSEVSPLTNFVSGDFVSINGSVFVLASSRGFFSFSLTTSATMFSVSSLLPAAKQIFD